MRSNLSYSAFKQVSLTKNIFKFERPELSLLIKKFNDLHDLIRKKDSKGPTDAFYELSKIMFIKIREDDKIHAILKTGAVPKKEDFIFSIDWIDQQAKVEPNPFDTILFRQIQQDLETQIKKGEKKRIFDKTEHLDLKASTIYEIVKTLQNYDLYGIDEDLNGRMFETFLNATVRGKDLGQFFTPRSVVHYMVATSSIRLKAEYLETDEIPNVLDGCCGSGGFLIDAMAQLMKQIDRMNQLTDIQKTKYKKKVKNEHLFGIDSAEKIARVSRLNMYLHEDGGSKIFKANTLDKDYVLDEGMSEEEKDAVKELKTYLDSICFQTVLTNPPFSISYKSSDEKEKKILETYEIAKLSGKLSASEKSNVLFIERYKDVLKENTGELLTIIDDTVLNGEGSQDYRDWILKNFIIIQVVSLPFNTFFRADANIKTSMIHLRRKETGEKQGTIFMAITNNIGQDDHQRDTPARDNLPTVEKYFADWKNTGKDFSEVIHNEHPDEPLGCPLQVFTVSAEKLNTKRLDAFYYSPELEEAKKQVISLFKKGEIDLKKGTDFQLIDTINKEEIQQLPNTIFKYFEIGNVTIDGSIVSHIEDYFDKLPTRARLQVCTNDVIFAKNNSSRGTTVIIPEWYNGNFVTSGFIGVRPKNYEDALILWSVMEAEFFRKQVYYYAITASQPEVRENIFNEEFLIPWPKTPEQRDKIIADAKKVDDARNSLKSAINQAKTTVRTTFFK